MRTSETKKPKVVFSPLKGFEHFAQMVRHIAVAHKLTIPEVLDKFGGPGIKREYERIVREEHAQLVGKE